jgi:acetylglutamate kinase
VSSVRVYKVGGPALGEDLAPELAREIRGGTERTVLVHGGGRQIEEMLRTLGIESRFVDGRRVTTPAGMHVVEMILSGVVNKSLASALGEAGVPAVGVSGRDAHLIRATPIRELGRVGTPAEVKPRLLEALWERGFIPVVSPVSNGPGGESLNVNADEAALAIARAVSADSLVYLSDVDGVRAAGRTLETLSSSDAARWIADGTIDGGMALKVSVALDAAAAGIPEVLIAGKARLQGAFLGTRIGGESR